MKKCINCHQKAEKLCLKGFCEDCHDAMHPNDDFIAAYDYNKGATNKLREVKP
jgi:hypothetical protein